jgi:hypothetical protein
LAERLNMFLHLVHHHSPRPLLFLLMARQG